MDESLGPTCAYTAHLACTAPYDNAGRDRRDAGLLVRKGKLLFLSEQRVCGWMDDGLTDGWVGGQTDGWMEKWVGGWIDGCMDEWMGGWVDG